MEDSSIELLDSFANSIDSTKEPLVVIIKSHLYTEYWIDVIIKNNSKNPQKLFKWNYANKLEYIYNSDLIPINLYQNLVKLNKLRNDCAHNIKFKFSEISHSDYNFFILDKELRRVPSPDGLFSTIVIAFVTYRWLEYHAKTDLGLEEQPISE